MFNKILRKIKDMIPWRLRLKMQEFLVSHPKSVFRTVRQHPSMPESIRQTYVDHMDKLGIRNLKGKTLCEVGVGDNLEHAFHAYADGAEKTYLMEIFKCDKSWSKVDSKGLLSEEQIKDEQCKNLILPDEQEIWDDYLKRINCVFMTEGLKSYKELPDSSIDVMFSEAVFEHIRFEVFDEVMNEMYRICKPGAMCSHVIDLRDHLGGGINQLRFSEEKWETDIHKRMECYVNRLRCSEIVERMQRAGFTVERVEAKKWDALPVARKKLAEPYRNMDDHELCTYNCWIIASKA
jgi:SAM-dependent methyltransferase